MSRCATTRPPSSWYCISTRLHNCNAARARRLSGPAGQVVSEGGCARPAVQVSKRIDRFKPRREARRLADRREGEAENSSDVSKLATRADAYNRRSIMRILVLLVFGFLATVAAYAQPTLPPFNFEIVTLSNRADLISGGDALVEVRVPVTVPLA